MIWFCIIWETFLSLFVTFISLSSADQRGVSNMFRRIPPFACCGYKYDVLCWRNGIYESKNPCSDHTLILNKIWINATHDGGLPKPHDNKNDAFYVIHSRYHYNQRNAFLTPFTRGDLPIQHCIWHINIQPRHSNRLSVYDEIFANFYRDNDK